MAETIRENVPLAPFTTLRLGGNARYFMEWAGADELRQALTFGRERGLPVQILGGGSNIIFPDAGFPGVVAKIGPGETAFRDEGDVVEVTAAGGVDWDSLVRQTVERGLAGIECLSGIPGTVGAAPVQNVGAYGQEIAETLVRVRCLDRQELTVLELERDECGFAYRQSRFKGADRDRFVILEVTLRLARGAMPEIRYPELERAVRDDVALDALPPADALARVRETVLLVRRRKSMVLDPDDPNARSVGSFFVNPVLTAEEYEALLQRPNAAEFKDRMPAFPTGDGVKTSAAWLVEQAGFTKGYRHDGVGISTRHALALVNHDGTTAELLELAGEIQKAVHDRFGIRLEREPVLAGSDTPG